MKSVKMKIIAAIVLCSLITASVISLLSISNSREMSNAAAEKELVMTCSNTTGKIDAIISKIEQSVDTLNDIAMERLDFARFQSDSTYVNEYTNGLLEDFFTFAEHTDGAITAYIRYNPEFTEPTSGIFLTRDNTESAFISSTPTDFSMYDPSDIAHVGWYYIPVENKAPIWMDPYLNENVNVYMISYVIPLYVDGVSVGIIGMDIDFSQLTNLVDSTAAFDTGYSFLVSSSGNVLYHKDISSGTDLAECNGGELKDVKEFVMDGANQEKTMQYRYNGMEKYLSYLELGNGMKLVLTAPVEEIHADANALSGQIFASLALGIVLAIVLGFLTGSAIAKPIKNMTQIIKQTSGLNFARTAELDKMARRRDETGVMATAVSDMQTVLRELIGNMENVKDNLVGNMKQLDNVMSENNAISEDNSTTTLQMAASIQETVSSVAMVAENTSAIRQNAVDIQELSQKEQEESRGIMVRARQLSEDTKVSNNKTMSVYTEMKKKT